MGATYDGAIRINTKIDTAGAKTGISLLTNSLKSFAAMAAVAFSITAIVNFGKACVEVASDLNEVQNVVDTTFGDSEYKIEKFADTAIEQFGLSTLAAKQYTGTMGAMLKSMGLTEDAAADMSIELAGLAGDIASFYNLTSDEAFAKIRSGISGETEPLKQLGINLSVANLEAYALAQGITTSYDAMTEQNKALLRYNYLLSVTSDAQGDFSKTSDSWANQVRILQQNFDKLKGTLGQIFLNVLYPAVKILNEFISDLNRAATAFANFIGIASGTSIDLSTSVSGAAASTDELTDSLTESGKAAKIASDGLADFDKLDVVGSSSTSGTDTNTYTVDVPAVGVSSGDFDSDIPSKIQENLDLITTIISGSLLALGAILLFSGTNILLGLGLMAVGAVGLATEIYANWDSVEPYITGALSGVTALVSESLIAFGALLVFSGAAIPLGLGLMAAGAVGLATVTALNWNEIITSLKGSVGQTVALASMSLLGLGMVIAFSGANLPLGIAMMASGAIGLATVTALNWDTIISELKGPVGQTVALASTALLGIGAILAFSNPVTMPLGIAMMAAGAIGLVTTAALNWDTIIDSLKGPVGEVVAFASISLLALGVVLAFSGVGLPLGIAMIAAGAVGLATVVALNWDKIKEPIMNTTAVITAIASGSLLALGMMLCLSGVGIPLGIGLLIAGAKGLGIAADMSNIPLLDKVKETINSIIGMVENGVNWIIEKINTISWDIPDWVPLIGGETFGFDFDMVSIPRLAQGAVIPPNREFMAVLGDQKHGTNIEAPADLIYQMVQKALADSGSATGTIELTIPITTTIDGKVLNKSLQKVQWIQGKTLVNGVY